MGYVFYSMGHWFFVAEIGSLLDLLKKYVSVLLFWCCSLFFKWLLSCVYNRKVLGNSKVCIYSYLNPRFIFIISCVRSAVPVEASLVVQNGGEETLRVNASISPSNLTFTNILLLKSEARKVQLFS